MEIYNFSGRGMAVPTRLWWNNGQLLSKNGKRSACKSKQKNGDRSIPKSQCSLPECVARGVTDMYFVPDKSKVNQEFFMNNILKPIIEKDIFSTLPGRREEGYPPL